MERWVSLPFQQMTMSSEQTGKYGDVYSFIRHLRDTIRSWMVGLWAAWPLGSFFSLILVFPVSSVISPRVRGVRALQQKVVNKTAGHFPQYAHISLDTVFVRTLVTTPPSTLQASNQKKIVQCPCKMLTRVALDAINRITFSPFFKLLILQYKRHLCPIIQPPKITLSLQLTPSRAWRYLARQRLPHPSIPPS